MAVHRDEAEDQLALVTCPKCGNTSEINYSTKWNERPPDKRGISMFYTERVYHQVLGDFRGKPVICDDPERYDAPDSRWMYGCGHCHHEWEAPDHADLYEVRKVLTHEQRVAKLDKTHRPLRLRPGDFRASDVVDDGMCRLVRVMADPEPTAAGGEFRVGYYMLGDDPHTVDRKAVSADVYPGDREFAVYRPIGPPDCVPADVVIAVDALTTGVKSRLVVKVVTIELEERFTEASVREFMTALTERNERPWWLLEPPPKGAARAIDL